MDATTPEHPSHHGLIAPPAGSCSSSFFCCLSCALNLAFRSRGSGCGIRVSAYLAILSFALPLAISSFSSSISCSVRGLYCMGAEPKIELAACGWPLAASLLAARPGANGSTNPLLMIVPKGGGLFSSCCGGRGVRTLSRACLQQGLLHRQAKTAAGQRTV